MPENLDSTLARVQLQPDFFVKGGNLTADQRAVIRPQDTWEISLINNLDEADRRAIDPCLRPLDPAHYTWLQVNEWFGTQKFLLGKKMGRAVEEEVLLQDAHQHDNLVRYRLCYTLNFPFKVALYTPPYVLVRDAVDAFLAMAEMLHPFRYPYFTVLWTNGLLNQNGS